ncbi:unnamed protein product [Gordionus sp. m RMFG-2023]|uniref:phosphatidylethanolamine N-methyltransferase-like n=1 Tax=Gordionus sp. m RMFG-2023 TaxID=3053472 RepID=UPI0030E1B916
MNIEYFLNIHEFYFRLALLFIFLSPLYWNIVGRVEYQTHFISKLVGDPLTAVYIFGISIFLLSSYRNWIFEIALKSQPKFEPFDNSIIHLLGWICLIIGLILVLGSFYRLGFVNTYLGDYFGFLLSRKIESFPFSIVQNPMYWGSSLNFIGTSLIHSSLAGIVLSVWIWIVYRIAIMFEEPFTEYIYSQSNINKSASNGDLTSKSKIVKRAQKIE